MKKNVKGSSSEEERKGNSPDKRFFSGFSKLLARVREEGLLSTIVREAGGVFVVKVLGAGAAFVAQIFLARWMGVRGFGIFTFVWTWVTILVLFGRIGADKALIRYIPEYVEKKEWKKLRGILQFTAGIAIGCCVILSVVGGAVAWWMKGAMPDGQFTALSLAFLTVPIYALVQTGKGGLQSFKRATEAYIPDLLLRHVATVGIGGLFFLAAPGKITALNGMGAAFLAILICLILTGWWLSQSIPNEVWAVEAEWDKETWVASMVPMMFIAGMHLLLKRTDLVMLGLFAGPEATGTYGAAAKISELSYFGLQAANSIMAPIIAELYHSGRHSELQRIVTWTARGSFGIYLLIAAVLMGGGTYVLALFGEAFTEGYGVLLILLAGQFANTLAGSVGFLMMMTGHETDSAKILVPIVLLNIALNYLLIPIFGIEGAGLATAVTTLAWNVCLVWYVWRKIGIKPTVFS